MWLWRSRVDTCQKGLACRTSWVFRVSSQFEQEIWLNWIEIENWILFSGVTATARFSDQDSETQCRKRKHHVDNGGECLVFVLFLLQWRLCHWNPDLNCFLSPQKNPSCCLCCRHLHHLPLQLHCQQHHQESQQECKLNRELICSHNQNQRPWRRRRQFRQLWLWGQRTRSSRQQKVWWS